ncbi:DUF2171 domain-containing protein [Deinococcus navajonensis]|uniref:DUF2171 domain-containing protein n=1 Tax=Deinococcus navajonensis TaxID=309884 RepID=A0ABV8XKF7_9DEIO
MTSTDFPQSAGIHPGMDVVCADGVVRGQVLGVAEPYLQMSDPVDGRAHHVPLSEVARTDTQVHLKLTYQQLINML